MRYKCALQKMNSLPRDRTSLYISVFEVAPLINEADFIFGRRTGWYWMGSQFKYRQGTPTLPSEFFRDFPISL
jgi:hypothetical protein